MHLLQSVIFHRSYMAKQCNCNTQAVVARQSHPARLSMLLLDRTAAAASFSSGIADDPIVLPLPLMRYFPISYIPVGFAQSAIRDAAVNDDTKHGSLFLANQISQGGKEEPKCIQLAPPVSNFDLSL